MYFNIAHLRKARNNIGVGLMKSMRLIYRMFNNQNCNIINTHLKPTGKKFHEKILREYLEVSFHDP
jgi:hypothetical protein